MSEHLFHPAVAAWFAAQFAAPTASQRAAWPAIARGQHVLIAAPTGSGKTLAAFLASIDRLVSEAIVSGLRDETQVIYVSPLKALSNDIQRNLEGPLAGIAAELQRRGVAGVEIRAQVRTGDTAPAQRNAMRKRPPHILVTTPESLYLLLTSESGRNMLASARSVIVDEIHAVAGSKRGSHLALSLERLDALCGRPLQRIGLSATQTPIDEVAHFLIGARAALSDCCIIDTGHVRARDLALELPETPLDAVMSNEVWEKIYDRLAHLVSSHRTTLIFANTRRMVERVSRHLAERLGEVNVAAHHGSLSKELRLSAEQRLKAGELRALIASSSLELGIDIGDVELVCQLASPRSISTLVQRVGRANHAVSGVPKGRLFPLSRDELIECTALLAAVRAGELDRLHIPPQPLDVLSQQIVAEVAARDYAEDELYELVCRAWPYRALQRKEFDELIRMLSDGVVTRRGRQSSHLHRDAVNHRLHARRGARLTAITCGGAIPDNADYQVVLEPTDTIVGTLNEDFAVESIAGDIFQLGNSSYRILRVEAGRVRVEDAKGQPPTIPFWLGEAPARSDELSAAVARLRAEVEAQLPNVEAATLAAAARWLGERHELPLRVAEQIIAYLGAAKAMLGALPTQQRLIFERFFDEAGGMQLVIHAPFGSRINRAFGLALRKRFCRKFSVELQAAATEDAIVLSLGETHSFALGDVVHYLHSNSIEALLTQAVLDAPLFTTRWRWTSTIALAVRRSRAGKKTPAPLQRMAAEDLVATVFPDQIACVETLTGEREIPEHPLVRQTLYDCLHEAMDIQGLITLLRNIEQGETTVLTRDLPHPSPLAAEILNAKPYAYLDDAPLEERRTQAVAARRWLDPSTAEQMGRLDPKAIEAVRAEAWPDPLSADELHDVLMTLGAIDAQSAQRYGWQVYFDELVTTHRATVLSWSDRAYWTSAEQLPLARAAFPQAIARDAIDPPPDFAARSWQTPGAVLELVRGRLQVAGPVTAAQLSTALSQPTTLIDQALLTLESEGVVLRGRFSADLALDALEWCERRLLARIHHYTIKSLRAQIEPVSSADFMRFLLEWQGVTSRPRRLGTEALASVIEQLEGFEVPASAWETDVLPARLEHYDCEWLDGLCRSGRAAWLRLTPPAALTAGPVRSTPIALLTRNHWSLWQQAAGATTRPQLSSTAAALFEQLRVHGASFFDELMRTAQLLPAQAEAGLGELVAAGLVSADSFSGLRALLLPENRRRRLAARGRRIALHGLQDAGRWSLARARAESPTNTWDAAQLEQVAQTLLARYGVMFRRLLDREAGWMPPWYDLLRVYRRLEAQGHIRGGRFVAGVGGEQYALPEAIGALRAIRRRPPDGQFVSLSAADPLNLSGVLPASSRVAALAGNRILLRDGALVATHAAGNTHFISMLEPATEWAARNALLRRNLLPMPANPN